MKTLQAIKLVMEEREWRTVPYLARQCRLSDDRDLHRRYDYYDKDTIGTPRSGDIEVDPKRCHEDDKIVCAKDEEPDDVFLWTASRIYTLASINQRVQDEGLIYERHNKGIPLLQILDVKPKYSSEEHVKYSWKLDEATKDCVLEINRSGNNEQGKKTVKFSLATNETDKLVSQLVDGYEMKYMLRTDAIRLRLELVMDSDAIPDFSNIHVDVKLEIEPGREPYTLTLGDQHLSKKRKLDQSNTLCFTQIIPRNLPPYMILSVALKDTTRMLYVEVSRRIFPYNIPVDQRDYIGFENGCIRLNVFWGCCILTGRGICTGVCTCEPYEFIGFSSPSEVSCSRMDGD